MGGSRLFTTFTSHSEPVLMLPQCCALAQEDGASSLCA